MALEKKLARKLDDLRRSLLKTKGTIKYDSSLPGTRYISSLAEFQEWQEKMGGDMALRDCGGEEEGWGGGETGAQGRRKIT